MGPEYTRLWNRAWELAEWIDDPAAAPIEERRARLSELLALRDRMAEIERQAAPDHGTSPPGTWHTWGSSTTTRGRTPENCPAKCKRSGKCHALAYFDGKPGPSKPCTPGVCPWEIDSPKKERREHDRQNQKRKCEN
jgi:hypothetical protein